MPGIRWTLDEYAAWLAKRGKTEGETGAAVPVADGKPNISHALDAEAPAVQVAQKFRVRVTSRGKRLADTDGNCVKAVLDGITKAGIWPDDSSKFVSEISFTQEAAEKNSTVIEIYVEDDAD